MYFLDQLLLLPAFRRYVSAWAPAPPSFPQDALGPPPSRELSVTVRTGHRSPLAVQARGCWRSGVGGFEDHVVVPLGNPFEPRLEIWPRSSGLLDPWFGTALSLKEQDEGQVGALGPAADLHDER